MQSGIQHLNEKKQAREFKRKYKVKTVNSASLCEALTTQGYTVIEFNGADDDENVSSLIDALQIRDQVAHGKCFTYQNDKYRLVFIHEDLSEAERTIVLAHEEGHIWNGHMSQDNVFGADIEQEHEANEFAHFLLKEKTGSKARAKIIATICALLIVVGVGVGIALKTQHDAAVYTDDLYRTETGSKYHLRDCMYMKDKTDVYRLTREEFESGDYEPCGACKPDER